MLKAYRGAGNGMPHSSEDGRRYPGETMDDASASDEMEDKPHSPAHEEALDDDEEEEEEEEEECRVCRGPAEDGRPLFAPCKCSGSIGLTHQDCLTSWLDVTRGDGRCELCATQFQFAPRYADGTPADLPPHEVILGLLRRALARWLPFGLRILLAVFLWLCVLPLATAYLYQGWLHRPTSVLKRMKWDLVAGDAVSGAVVAAVIIISFLSLMSFADFLRFHWQQGAPRPPVAQQQRRNVGNDDAVDDGHFPPVDGGIDNGFLDHDDRREQQEQNDQPLRGQPQPQLLDRNALGVMDQRQVVFADQLGHPDDELAPQQDNGRDDGVPPGGLGDDVDDDRAEDALDVGRHARPDRPIQGDEQNEAQAAAQPPANEDDDVAQMMRAQEEQDRMQDQLPQQQAMIPPENADPPPMNDDRFEPQFEPLDPVFDQEEDGMDMEIHVALDELLGLRGPVSALIRNLLWLLAFNTTYLGLFAFIPHTIGESIYSMASNNTAFSAVMNRTLHVHVNGTDSFLAGIDLLHEESKRLNTALTLPDVASIGLGYISMTCFVFLLQGLVSLVGRYYGKEENGSSSLGQEPQRPVRPGDGEAANEEREPLVNQAENEEVDQVAAQADQRPDAELDGSIGRRLNLILECAAAIVKVGLLLFLKMLLLPLLLGIWLDAATLPLFGNTFNDRIVYAGGDLFGSILLHWVAGITFMLLVTVSVLQLREVAHPDLLARVIRPQEPQPDLLGNLLQESGITHTKRMLLSLGIYAALLSIHIWLPARLLVALGIVDHVPFFRPKLWHICLPQLQVPVELLVFHLTMLAFLEKYKNRIGEMQHYWLVFMCDRLGLTDHILPRSVDRFDLEGVRPLYLKRDCAEEGAKEDTMDGEKKSEFSRENLSKSDEDAVKESPGSSSTEAGPGKEDRPTSDGELQNSRDGTPTQVLDKFWHELLSIKGGERDHFIRSNLEAPGVATAKLHDDGETRDGQRVLSASQSYIRLPQQIEIRSFQSDDTSRKKSSRTARTDLLPTTMGAYRLRRRVIKESNGVAADDTPVIEFWREVLGKPIPRPPEGWDDLGVGGAESQGRWAWGKERKSEVEESVAHRIPFWSQSEKSSFARFRNVYPLAMKMAFLLALSWIAVTAAVCIAMSSPLILGRSVLYLLRIQDRYCHDPAAFAIGAGIVVPLIKKFGQVLLPSPDSAQRSSIGKLIMTWLSSFRRPGSTVKIRVMLLAAFLWMVVSPLFLGILYELCLVRSARWWAGEENWMSWSSVLLSWGTGTLLLNGWAAFCYNEAFTKHYWIEMVMGADDDENIQEDAGLRNNGAGEAVNRNERNGVVPEAGNQQEGALPLQNRDTVGKRLVWQGRDGRIAQCIETIAAVLCRWEWDKIDYEVLIQECTVPVSTEFGISLLVPCAAYIGFLTLLHLFSGGRDTAAAGFVFPLIGFVGKGVYRAFLFRSLAVTVVLFQLAVSFQSPLEHWFKAAHDVARDDRYLIGEILQNYRDTTKDGRSPVR